MGIPKSLLNQTLALQRETISDDGMGGRTGVWSDVGSFKARISPISATERLMQNKETMTTTHRIYCDPMTVTPKDRIRWGAYYFEIVAITDPSERYHHLEIDAKEINYP